jgi:hypothetical protein
MSSCIPRLRPGDAGNWCPQIISLALEELQNYSPREPLGTAAAGNGSAIPHVGNPVLLPFGRPRVSQNPFDFDALDQFPAVAEDYGRLMTIRTTRVMKV